MNEVEEAEKEIEKIKEMFIYLKNHGWINDIKKEIDVNKAIEAIETLLTGYEKEKEKNKKAKEFIDDKNNYFEDGENWQNILKIKEILEE